MFRSYSGERPPFWEEPYAIVLSSLGERGKCPSIKVKDEPLVTYFELAVAGYGSVDEIEKWDARRVLQALAHMKFRADWQAAWIEANKTR